MTVKQEVLFYKSVATVVVATVVVAPNPPPPKGRLPKKGEFRNGTFFYKFNNTRVN
jgi:hypothetical protein